MKAVRRAKLSLIHALIGFGFFHAGNLVAENMVIRQFAIKANQGAAVDRDYLYAISNTRIEKCDKQSGKLVAAWQANRKLVEQKHFKHLNSGMVFEGRLYCAHSRFPIAKNDCSVEIFDVAGEGVKHVETVLMPAKYGSLTWIDRRGDGTWWMCYAHYGKHNSKTRLIQYRYQDGKFTEQASYSFPAQVVANWGSMSCSGGSWGPDGKLYTTGHDHSEAYMLHVDAKGRLNYLRTEKNMGFYGQGIAWDRSTEAPMLWGIVKNRNVSATKLVVTK
ncbi:MAG: hypothetical protein ACPIA7_09455 [Akkermansiaceae bacterium]